MKHNPHVINLAKEPKVRIHPDEGAKRGIHNASEVILKNNGNSITAKIAFDDRVAQGAIVVPLGFDKIPIYDLGTNPLNGLLIDLERRGNT